MNLDDAAAWARNHKAVAISGGVAALLALLWLHHRSKTNAATASDTAGATGATVNGAGDYLVPFSNTSDPTGMSSDNGNLATAITGLTTALAGLTIPRSTDPTGGQPSTGSKPPLSAHQLHLRHLQHQKAAKKPTPKPAPKPLSAHELHVQHTQHVHNTGIKSPAPSATKTPTGAHSGQTATPGGATSTGSPSPGTTRRVVPPRRPAFIPTIGHPALDPHRPVTVQPPPTRILGEPTPVYPY